MSRVARRAPGPAGWTDATDPHAEGHPTLLTVVPAPDGLFPEIIGPLPQPEPGGPADPERAASGRAPGPPAGLVIHRDQRRVLLDGQEIELVFQEFELLEFLTAHPYRVFTREQIIAGAWVGHQQATGRTVDVHIHRLRRKLGPGYARYVVTVRRIGYTFRPLPHRFPAQAPDHVRDEELAMRGQEFTLAAGPAGVSLPSAGRTQPAGHELL